MSSKDDSADRRRFIQVPVDLLLAYRTRPRHAAVYALIARLCEIARGPVALSRDDMALLFDATRNDPVGVQIERAIRDMRCDGWLLHTNQGQPGKRELLVTWGQGRDGQPRPWRFREPHRGRPAPLATTRLPLALLDHYLGRLVLQPDAPAQVERYVSAPLLGLADLSTFLLRQVGAVPPTARLTQLGLVDGVPDLAALLAQVDAGTLVIGDGAAALPITLTDAGVRQLQRCRAAGDLPYPDARHGSLGDPCAARHGSRDGSPDSHAHYAPQCHEPHQDAIPERAWDQDGIENRPTHMHPTPQGSPPCATPEAAVGMTDSDFYVTQEDATQALESAVACDEKHKRDLDPEIVTAHTLLNPARAILAAEWWALGLLVQEQGSARVLCWQRRAAGAGRTCITLPYYNACAATEALGQAYGRAPEPVAAPRAAAPPVPVPAPPDTAMARPPRAATPRPAPSPSAPLSDAQQALVAQISTACGTRIRYPEKLACAPLPLLERWAAVAGHPGLRAKGDPAALFVHAAALGKEPPSAAELGRWAEAGGVHWSQLGVWSDGAAASPPPAAPPLPEPRVAPPVAPLPVLPAGPATPPSWTAQTLQTALHGQLRLMCPRPDWPLIAALVVQALDRDRVLLACATVQQHAQIGATLHGVIGSALDDLAAPGTFQVRVGAAPPGRPVAPVSRAASRGAP